MVVLFLFNVLKPALRRPTNHDYFLRFSIAGRGNFFVKNTGRRVVWIEKRWSRLRTSLSLTMDAMSVSLALIQSAEER